LQEATDHPVFKSGEYRCETDTFGEISVPKNMYYGANTARSLIHFSIGDKSERMPVSFEPEMRLIAFACKISIDFLESK
jgi:fumarate hydratase class II